ncbi:hypothetical protein KFE25_010176 [Diacronema lutheri]|uniref:Sulfate transporter n=2 Tax=Diacronema lutheri TaxID=2081491 RepID=A0A8J5XDJ4_DIALT|nr:hypothetical protein KFE25_010176 [Diacronema lutheri]
MTTRAALRVEEMLRSIRERLTLGEVSGSLGDLGLFLPLFLGMHRLGKIAAVPALFWAGAFNVVTGVIWDLPMCVQPMKTIAAAAITGELTAIEVNLAGMLVSGIISILAATRTLHVASQLLPAPLVRGIQLGFGLRLVASATAMVLPANAGWDALYAGKGLGLSAVVFALALLQSDRVPAALILSLVGLALAASRAVELGLELPFTPGMPFNLALAGASWVDVGHALWKGALPQLPLTVLNSVIAVCQLAHDLKPAVPITNEGVAYSVGMLNLVGCPFGAMPMCHGAGGLAGQWRFGARFATSVKVLGTGKMLVAVLGGGSFVKLLDFFPTPLLGAMLVFSGIELATAGLRGTYAVPTGASVTDVRAARDAAFLCLGTAGFVVGMGTGIGALAGVTIVGVQRLRDLAEQRASAWKPMQAFASPRGDEPQSAGALTTVAVEDATSTRGHVSRL